MALPSTHLGHLHRKKKLRCSSLRLAETGRLTSMYEMLNSSPSCATLQVSGSPPGQANVWLPCPPDAHCTL